MAVDRLNQTIELNSGSHVRILYGAGIEDVFIDKDLNLRCLDEALWDYLNPAGFERIAFYSPQQQVYFLDDRSEMLSHAGADRETVNGARANGSQREMQRLKGGPLATQVVLQSEALFQPAAFSGMGDLHALLMLDSIIKESGGPRSAVIINQAETVLRFCEDQRSLAALIGDWTRLSPTNQNICLLIFSCQEKSDLSEVVSRAQIPELRKLLHKPTEVMTPARDEVNWLIEHVVNHRRLSVNRREQTSLVKWMVNEGLPAREWIERLSNIQRLDSSTARQQHWFSAYIPGAIPARDRLEALVGLQEVKRRVVEMSSWIALRSRQNRLNEDDFPLMHMIFSGNPGTGKTTVARLIGELYHEAGLLKRGHLVEARAGDLIAEFVGGTATRTNALIDSAMDGVLFIDEAYMLTERERGGFGQEALDTLLTRMEDDRNRLVVIAAGYPDRMDAFITSNPGLERRFPPDNQLRFPDYNANELLEILKTQAAERSLAFSNEVGQELPALVHNLYQSRSETFGNAGEMRNLLEACDRRRAARIYAGRLSPEEPVGMEDFPEHYRDYFNVKQVDLDDLFSELDNLVGLKPVKAFIHRQVRLLQLENMRSIKNQAQASPRSLNMLFMGNPGTGKTTVARLFGRMLKNLGLLRKGHCVETSRVDLVAGYVGQTALKTEAKVKEALDGVLLIDEAYALARGGQSDYGQEAVDTLVKLIDRYAGRLVVIAAGYPKEMKHFVESNPGLASRFSNTVNFPDYSTDELWEILIRLAANNDYAIDTDARESVIDYITGRKKGNARQFGNARMVHNLFEEMKTNLAVRLLDNGEPPVDTDSLFCLQALDIPGAP